MTKPRTTNALMSDMAAKRKARSEESIALINYLIAHPGPHSVAQLCTATGYSEKLVRGRMQAARDAGEASNVAENGHPARWQHPSHAETNTRENLVNRRDPICNAGMPNGSRSYWAKQMAAFNTPPRAV